MTASNLPSWAVNVQCGINPIALHGLIQTTTLTKKKKRLNKKQGLVHLPALVCIDKGLVTPSFKVTVEDRVHTHLDLCLQSIPKGWRPAITVTDPDNRLIYADWRACHLQLIAYCSGDAAMTQFFESSPDFYTALPVPKPPMPADADEQAGWRKKVKYALNAYLNGSTGPAMYDPKGSINWKQNEALAFVAGLDTLFQTAWQTAGDWCNQLRDDVYDCSRYIAHCEEKGKTRTKRKALGIALMRLEAEILNTVLDHPTFSESYGGRVIMPMRDGVLVECPEHHQADLAQWLGGFMTLKSTDGNQDRADNHVSTHVDVEVHGTSWGQVDGEDVAPLVGDDFMDEASDAADSATEVPELLLAASHYEHDLKTRRRMERSNIIKRQVDDSFRAIREAADWRADKLAPPETPVDPNLPVLIPKRNADGDVVGVDDSVLNLALVLRDDPTFDLWYNEWDHEIYSTRTGEKVDEKTWQFDVTSRCEQTYGWKMRLSLPLFNSATLAVAREDTRHPLKDSIDALEWDGVPRIDTWLQDALYGVVVDFEGVMRLDHLESDFGITKDEFKLTGVYGKNLLIAMMARLYDPGCKVDTILVLAGLQGTGKQKLFQTLAGSCPKTDFSFYGGTKRAKKDADAALQGLKLWLWEDQEMSGHVGAKGEDVKAFLSNQVDDVRLPYGRSNERVKRHWVAVGSTNDPEKLLEDATGSRRYNCVRTPQYAHRPEHDPLQPTIDVAWVSSVRDQLLAEACHRYKAGEPWWFERNDPHFSMRAKVNKSMFTRMTVIDEFAARLFEGNGGSEKAAFTMTEFLSQFDPDLTASKMGGRIDHAASKALKKAGFIKKKVRLSGKPANAFVKVLPTGTTPIHTRTGFADANREHGRSTMPKFDEGIQDFSI
jgi:hypothetical protein